MPLIKLLIEEIKKDKLPVPIEWLQEELVPNFDVGEFKSQSVYDESNDELRPSQTPKLMTVDEIDEACSNTYGENWKEELELGKKYEMKRNNHTLQDAVNIALENMKSNDMYYSKAMQMIDKPEEIDLSTTGSEFSGN